MSTPDFEELIYYRLVVTTPQKVSAADLEKQIASGKWKYEVEIGMYVRGKVEGIESTEIISDESGARTFECVVMLMLECEFWNPIDPDDYTPSEMLETFSASVELPHGWEIIETSFA